VYFSLVHSQDHIQKHTSSRTILYSPTLATEHKPLVVHDRRLDVAKPPQGDHSPFRRISNMHERADDQLAAWFIYAFPGLAADFIAPSIARKRV
jgi:hypothetical protein